MRNWFGRYPWVLLVLTWAWLYLPGLGAGELRHEEGHRAGASREMLWRGDPILPTFHGQPYINKPPGYYWLVMLCSLPGGEVNEWTLRLPSALSVLVGALAVCAATTALGGHGLVAGLGWLVMPEIWWKGTLGEIDAFFGVLIFLALCCAWRSNHSAVRWPWVLLGGVLLGWAVLTKGPLAWMFFYLAVVLWVLWVRRWRWLLSPYHLTILTLSLVLAALWLLLLGTRMELRDAYDVWFNEVGAARISKSWWQTALKVLEYPVALIGGMAPGSLAASWMWCQRPADDTERTQRRAVTCGSLGGFVLLWLHGRRVRYALPIAPVLAMAPGFVIMRYRWLLDHRLTPRLTVVAILIAGFIHAAVIYWQAADDPRRQLGQRMAAVLTEHHSDTVYTLAGAQHYLNASFYIDRPLQALHHWSQLPDGQQIVITHARRMPPEDSCVYRVLFRDRLKQDPDILILEVVGISHP